MAGKSQFALLKTRRFLPLFVTQALSAFNDNAYRFAVAAILVTSLPPEKSELLNTISAALFTLPFFLLSATAGKLADKFDKAWLARRIKLAEVGIIALSAFALFTDSVVLKQFCIFLAGLQAAMFGPIKFGILPQHLKKDELLGGNGMVEMATFVAILLGTIFGNMIVSGGEAFKWFVASVMVAIGVISYFTARQIPEAPAPTPDLPIRWNVLAETWSTMKLAQQRPIVFQAILGISWFWLLGVVFVTQMQAFTNGDLRGTPAVASLIFAIFSIGIALGSVFCNKLLDGKISLKYVPIAALLMSIFMFDLYFAGGAAQRSVSQAIAANAVPFEKSAAGVSLVGIGTSLSFFHVWRALFDLAVIAFLSGLFVVPLFALMQARTPYYQRAQIVGSNNIYNAFFMVAATIASVALLGVGCSVRGLFLVLAFANLMVAIYIIRILPHDTLAGLVRAIFRFFYQVEVKGLHNLGGPGKRSLVIANHTSLLDGPLLSAFLPEKAAFAIDTQMAKKWWVKPAFALFELCPIDPGNAFALRSLAQLLKKGKKVVIFPEGRLTKTGGLMKVYEGPAAIAQMASGQIVPVHIEGAQYTPFSRLKGVFPTKLFPKITIRFLEPVSNGDMGDLKGSALREAQAQHVYDVMTDTQFRSANIDQTLWQALLDARALHGRKRVMLEDIQRTPITYNRLVLGSFILGKKLADATPGEKNIGLLLPNATGTVLSFFGLHAYGRVPAMLNFSTGAMNMSAACLAAEVRTIVTSRKFIEAGEMEKDLEVLSQNRKIIYLEDIRESVGLFDKLRGLWQRTFTGLALRRAGASRDPNAPAVILFTSGSEGVPKGVVLSHRNLNANRLQAAARIAFSPNDSVFNALPMFHAFGLLGGTLLPLMWGIRIFMYPSPLHYKIVPELCYDTGATVLFGTDTFLAGYAKNAHPYDFYNMRLVVAGAERLKDETRNAWMEQFGLRILEGYGATECAPVLAVNTPMHNKKGTVGRLLDGIEYRLEPVEGIENGGRLHVKGPNVMLGYLRADNPGVIEAPKEGWYDTGDIVNVDDRKFITILGRAKRFCKVAGEMVSLNAIETKLQQLYPDQMHCVVAAPDKKKGEQLVMFTTLEKPDRKEIADGLRKLGSSELAIPKNIFTIEAIPVLGSGKTDYVSLNRMAREKVQE